jgi:hypothetical protein
MLFWIFLNRPTFENFHFYVIFEEKLKPISSLTHILVVAHFNSRIFYLGPTHKLQPYRTFLLPLLYKKFNKK